MRNTLSLTHSHISGSCSFTLILWVTLISLAVSSSPKFNSVSRAYQCLPYSLKQLALSLSFYFSCSTSPVFTGLFLHFQSFASHSVSASRCVRYSHSSYQVKCLPEWVTVWSPITVIVFHCHPQTVCTARATHTSSLLTHTVRESWYISCVSPSITRTR